MGRAMANKLPWMKHDHNARNDDFIKRACGRFGHFGYSGWFRMLEVLHEHGTGDKLCITRSRFASELGSKWPPVGNLLAFCQESGKVRFTDDGKELVIEVKNFRKKQGKKGGQNDQSGDLENSKQALEEEEEGEEDNNRLGFRKILNGVTAKVAGWRYSAGALEDHRFPFGKDKGRRILDLEASRCEFYMRNFQVDAKTAAALKHRIKIKAEEGIAR